MSFAHPSFCGFEIDLFKELNQLTGIAAILTFPLDVEVVEMEERESKGQGIDEAEERTDGIGGDQTPAGT